MICTIVINILFGPIIVIVNNCKLQFRVFIVFNYPSILNTNISVYTGVICVTLYICYIRFPFAFTFIASFSHVYYKQRVQISIFTPKLFVSNTLLLDVYLLYKQPMVICTCSMKKFRSVCVTVTCLNVTPAIVDGRYRKIHRPNLTATQN